MREYFIVDTIKRKLTSRAKKKYVVYRNILYDPRQLLDYHANSQSSFMILPQVLQRTLYGLARSDRERVGHIILRECLLNHVVCIKVYKSKPAYIQIHDEYIGMKPGWYSFI